MGRRKTCIKNRLKNLHKNPPKVKSQAPELVKSSTSEPGIDCDSESEAYTSDLELEDSEDKVMQEIQIDSDLLAFAAKLQAAHDSMVRKERERREATKRKPVYMGNSDRTKWRQRLEGKKMEAAGFPSIVSFFQKNAEPESSKQEDRIQITNGNQVQGTRYVTADPEIVEIQQPSQSERVTDPQADVAADSDAESEFPTTFDLPDHQDLPALRRAKAELIVRHKKDNLKMFICARVTSMIALISLYIDLELGFGWMKCSKLAAEATGRRVNHA
ncbi:uncharacterized protein HD556DRAFT_1453977 [Suillus plorans]|uniref:Uncharacterized protein n=1 Tax=Suillus plorans TaxID=116603 RepID=A0A9P7E3J0_9AGAM|nr:uncharacterized protein HD556DRAFT_1453977 [Suillus plorans]KAG1810307.1 hypothetical protein HD556DRAFT_1453977 [Suillus plorans]